MHGKPFVRDLHRLAAVLEDVDHAFTRIESGLATYSASYGSYMDKIEIKKKIEEPRHFRDSADRQRQQREPRSITDLEVRHAVLDQRRKRRSYFYLRATPVPEPNAEYVDPPEYQGRLEELKIAVRQCGRPVRDYWPEWTGQGFVGLKEFGDFVLDDLWSGVLRDERYVPKAVWRQVLNADPDTDSRYTDESQPVPRELWEKIVALAKPPPQDPLDAERQRMEAFAESRLRWFQGRTRELQQLIDLEQHGHNVLFDKTEVKAGEDWRRSITDGTLHSQRVVSFLSKQSM